LHFLSRRNHWDMHHTFSQYMTLDTPSCYYGILSILGAVAFFNANYYAVTVISVGVAQFYGPTPGNAEDNYG